jgi:predicted porin
MNKKLVAVAIAGLLVAPLAQAQTANVTLYGRLNLDLEFVKGQQTNGSNPTQYRVSSDSSRFGLRGTESLGGGLNAIFQVENSLSPDNSGGTLAGRDTFIGLQGGWGTFKTGFYHLPYDNIHGYIWGSNPTLETGILATSSIWAQGFATKQGGGFDSRIGNSIRWDTPIIAGWQGQFSYSIGGGATGTEGTPKSNSGVSSGAIFFMSGPIYFGAAFQYNEQVRAAGLNDIAYSIAGAYQFPKVRVGAIYERLDYDCQGFASGPTVNPLTPAQIAAACVSSPTTFGTSSLTRNMYGVDLTIDIGPGQLYADWSYGDNGKGSAPDGARIAGLAKGDNSSSNQWEISYTYPLSKRTSLYTGYTQIVNKSAASYNFSVNSYPIAIGGKPQGFVMGMWHNF